MQGAKDVKTILIIEINSAPVFCLFSHLYLRTMIHMYFISWEIVILTEGFRILKKRKHISHFIDTLNNCFKQRNLKD